ncbi:MAG: hypothetical protein HFJ79_00880 [Clostridiales bacterium]|nr:hypothetical protein [Clostridiales bacterium]
MKRMVNGMSKESVNISRENIQQAFKVFCMTILAALISFFIFMSISFIASGVSTQTIGYQIVQIEEDGSSTLITEHLYAADDTTIPSETKNTGEEGAVSATGEGETATASSETTLPSNQVKQYIRSEMSPAVSAFVDVLSSVLMILLLIAMPYSVLWKQGDRDSNAVHFGRMEEDRLRGLKVGLLAGLPSFAAYLLLLVSKLGLLLPNFLVYYRLGNVPFLPLINRMVPASTAITAEVPWTVMLVILLTLAVVPLTAVIAYRWGYRHFSLSEVLTYKKKKK